MASSLWSVTPPPCVLGFLVWSCFCEVIRPSDLLWARGAAIPQKVYCNILWYGKPVLRYILRNTWYLYSCQLLPLVQYLRNTSATAMNCWVIIHCLEVSCKEDQITSAQREWFIFVQLTDKQWIITQQFTHWSWSISILTHNKRRKHIRSLQLLPTFRHCTEELPLILRLHRIHLHVIVKSFKRKNDVTPSNTMNDVIFGWRQLSHTLAVNYCPIYHSLLPLAL